MTQKTTKTPPKPTSPTKTPHPPKKKKKKKSSKTSKKKMKKKKKKKTQVYTPLSSSPTNRKEPSTSQPHPTPYHFSNTNNVCKVHRQSERLASRGRIPRKFSLV